MCVTLSSFHEEGLYDIINIILLNVTNFTNVFASYSTLLIINYNNLLSPSRSIYYIPEPNTDQSKQMTYYLLHHIYVEIKFWGNKQLLPYKRRRGGGVHHAAATHDVSHDPRHLQRSDSRASLQTGPSVSCAGLAP